MTPEQEKAVIEKYKAAITAILGEGWTLYNTSRKVDYSEKLMVGKYELRMGEDNVEVRPYEGATKVTNTYRRPKVLAFFELHPMINCCGICVSTQAFVHESVRNKGLGTLLNSFRIDVARLLGYGCLLCTDIESNTYQRKILMRNGWTDIHKFVNPRTRNVVHISVINL